MIIAEVGINHNGNLSTAIDLIDAAVYTGADAVKFQNFDNISHLRKYTIKGYKQDIPQLKKYCDEKGIKFLSTPHTFEYINMIDKYVDIHKVASSYLGNINFLKEVASKEKPMLISTGNFLHNNGMATIEEIVNALSHIPDADVTLLHCVSKYPCKKPHYDRIDELIELGYPVGLSDHSKGINLPRGLPVYEKHLMLDEMDCVDKDVSLTPEEFKEMVDWLKE